MNHQEAGNYWDRNADTWTRLARAGHDLYRDHLNTPAFFEILPAVKDLAGLDIGCGEGHNTRLLAQRGARMTAIDISPKFIDHAKALETADPIGIDYRLASAVALPFPSGQFDFATAFMCFMDIPETAPVLAEAFRILKPGGFLQFSITHPCFDTPHRRNLRTPEGQTYAIEVGNYFQSTDGRVDQWTFSGMPAAVRTDVRKFDVPRFHRTVSSWLNLMIAAGFSLERIEEPAPTEAALSACPTIRDAQIVAYFLHIRARKPAR